MTETPAIREATTDDIGTIRNLAERIWRVSYPGIISLEQIEYMLGWMYAAERIFSDMRSRQIRYLLVSPSQQEAPVGFAGYGPGDTTGEIFLHKLYIDPDRQRSGLGSALLREVIRRAEVDQVRCLSLRVNRNNAPAIRAYEKNGFAITSEVCADIGDGYVMDDFVMSLPIGTPSS